MISCKAKIKRGIKMKSKQLVSMAALVLLSSMVFAGLVQPAPVMVTVNTDLSGFAQGDMATARFSASDLEMIGCGIRAIDDGAGGVFDFGFCQAIMDDGSAEGLSVFCSTQRSDLLDTMKSTSDFSFVTFAWNAAGECTRVGFSTQSFYIPDSKAK